MEEGAEVEDKVEDVEGSPGQEEYNRDQDQHHVRLPSSLHLTSSSEYSLPHSLLLTHKHSLSLSLSLLFYLSLNNPVHNE